MQNPVTPNSRLYSAVPFVKAGARVADIGTDHAYLPIYLVKEQIASWALAADINKGPIESAKSNIREAGLEGRIDTLQTDGLEGVEAYAPDTVLIFGMGGELIVSILQKAPWIKKKKVTLVLQPMTRASVLRSYLAAEGFETVGEALTREGDRFYQTLCVSFADKPQRLTEEEALLGRFNLQNPPPLFRDFIRHEIKVFETIEKGKSASKDGDAAEEKRVLAFLHRRLEILP